LAPRRHAYDSTVKRSSRVAVALAVAVVLAGAAAAFVLLDRDDNDHPASGAPIAHVERCRGLADDAARECFTREFLAMVEGEDDPRPAVAAIARAARPESGFLLSNCHGLMHTVGRTYARDAGVTLGTLMDYLPKSNDPGCSAGFAHGLVTAVASDIDLGEPREAATVCAESGTRYQRYSCVHGFGHAFMRIHGDRLRPALDLCRALGPQAAPDCAQGAYHDYWFAVVGVDDASLPGGDAVTNPWELCTAQPAEFVRPCWYRAFVDNRPEAFGVQSPSDLDDLCDGLTGLQRGACITAASVIGPPDPALQLRICAHLERASDAANCVRGTKVQNLLGSRIAAYIDLIRRCQIFAPVPRAACYRWLGKTLAVVTDGVFARAGCPRLGTDDARRQCRAGAQSMNEALVTFS
jgi:hypothetical protein